MPDTSQNVQTNLITHQLTYQLPDGHYLFPELNLTLSDGITGLIGRNGCGKSTLARLLTGDLKPGGGQIDYGGLYRDQIGYFSQFEELNDPDEVEPHLNTCYCIADYLGVRAKLNALEKIEQGSCEPHWFEILSDDWLIRERLKHQLKTLNLPEDPFWPIHRLSGGQQTRLRLANLFNHADAYRVMILDEPSNHLDLSGRHWLSQQLEAFEGAVLMISHDFTLLNRVNRIWELDQNGITEYGGNLDLYQQEKQLQRAALMRERNDLQKQARKLKSEHQKNIEKAQQKAAKGNRLRKSGSQSKLILDAQKEKAGNHLGTLNRRLTVRDKQLSDHREQLQQQLSEAVEIRIPLDGPVWDSAVEHTEKKQNKQQRTQGRKTLASLVNYQLPSGMAQAITLQLSSTDRLYLKGDNGSGKSTLFKLLAGIMTENRPTSYTPSHSTRFSSHSSSFIYLDQHFSRLDRNATLLGQLQYFDSSLAESQARTLLAGIGFRRDRVFLKVADLSGGEKMRLALLGISLRNQKSADQTFLLLDEPDNHLDLTSKQLLADSLSEYSGGFALISHDEAFVKRCRTDVCYWLRQSQDKQGKDGHLHGNGLIPKDKTD